MSVICMGELLIDFVSVETGVSVGDAPGFLKAPGGAPANVAVAVRRLGVPSAFLTQVGDDPFGHYLEAVLRAEGVDTRGIVFSDTARTTLAFVSNRADGERSFVFYRHPSADMLMRTEDVALAQIAEHRVFHFGSLTMIVEPSRSATLAAAERARADGLFISYDPNLRRALWASDEAARAGMMLGIPYAHLLKVSDEELVFLTGGEDARALWREGMQMLVITHGAGGATLYTDDSHFHVPGFAVDAVDTTGAGDAFVAGLLVKMLELGDGYTDSIPEMVTFANAVGAMTTMQKGAIPALPTRAEAEAFLKTRAAK